MTELTTKYLQVAVTFAKGKKWRPGGNKPYMEVLLALARFPDSVASFDKVLALVPERRRPGIKAIRPRIAEVIHDQSTGVDLRQQLAFDPDSGFSIEDPLYRYFLTHLDTERLYAELGIEATTVESGRVYTYDVAFSFAGEVRQTVEAVNEELKSEDVVTFYDYDQQAVLLALDLQEALAQIYAQSCRYYIVFLDARYKEKVWTRWEQDILTHSGRSGHIVPVVLDNAGEKGLVGIPSTVGRVDLRDVQSETEHSGNITSEGRVAIRNRLFFRCWRSLTLGRRVSLSQGLTRQQASSL